MVQIGTVRHRYDSLMKSTSWFYHWQILQWYKGDPGVRWDRGQIQEEGEFGRAHKGSEVLLQTLQRMNLQGNEDRTTAKLGGTLTGVSINKPLIRKKEASLSSSSSTGGEYQWLAHICMQAQSSEGQGIAGASPMALTLRPLHWHGERAHSVTAHPVTWSQHPPPTSH